MPLKSGSPTFFVFGIGSPVRADSSTTAATALTLALLLLSLIIRCPSTGIKSPGRTTSKSPTFIKLTPISSIMLFFFRWAIRGDRAKRASKEVVAFLKA